MLVVVLLVVVIVAIAIVVAVVIVVVVVVVFLFLLNFPHTHTHTHTHTHNTTQHRCPQFQLEPSVGTKKPKQYVSLTQPTSRPCQFKLQFGRCSADIIWPEKKELCAYKERKREKDAFFEKNFAPWLRFSLSGLNK